MPYKVEIGGGVKVECETVDDVLKLMEAMRGVDPGPAGSGGTPPPRDETLPAATQGESMSVRLLRAVHAGGRHGVLNSTLAQRLGLGTPRGLGPVVVGLRNELARGASMHQTDAVTVSRSADGVRYFPTERTAEAIRRLVQTGGAS